MKKYMFDNAKDMIDLAQEIQTRVYWNMRFYYEEEDEIDSIAYKDFWALIVYKMDEGAIGVTISNNDHVEFVR